MSLVTSSVLVLWFLGFWIFHALCKMKKKLNSRKLNYCGFAQYFYWISSHFQVLYPHRHWQPTVAGIFVYFKYAVIPFSIFSKSHNVIHIMLIQVQHLNKVLYVVASKNNAYLKQHFQQVSCSVGFGWEVKTGWECFISTSRQIAHRNYLLLTEIAQETFWYFWCSHSYFCYVVFCVSCVFWLWSFQSYLD